MPSLLTVNLPHVRDDGKMADDDLTEEIRANAARPQSTTVDGETLTERSLKDLTDYEKHVAAQKAVQQAPFGIRFAKIVPPGAT